MKRQIWQAMIYSLLGALILTVSALAMSSPSFSLNWQTPLNSGAGGASSSTNYAINFTLGQAVIGSSSSPNYQAGIGFWYGADVCERCTYLPIIAR